MKACRYGQPFGYSVLLNTADKKLFIKYIWYTLHTMGLLFIHSFIHLLLHRKGSTHYNTSKLT